MPSRRTVLATSAAVLTTTAAGCAQIGNFVANQIVGDVTLINYVEQRIPGTITVAGPAGDTLLEESFELGPNTDDEAANSIDQQDNATGQNNSTKSEEETEQAIVPYQDVWTDSGSYEVTVSFADVEIDGVGEATETVSIEQPDEEKLGVFVDTAPPEPVLEFYVETSATDLLGKKEQD